VENIASVDAFLTAEGIETKTNIHKQDIGKLTHLDFGAGFAPNYVDHMLPCMFADLGQDNMLDFLQPKKVMHFIAET
jgi:hypothetical protein